jgi:hypothetical protein
MSQILRKETVMNERVSNLKSLVGAQRKANDARLKAQRAAWDEQLGRLSPDEVGPLLREIAANPVAW